MARTVTVLPLTINRQTAAPIGSTAKRKVAAYARVSTDHEEQQTSYEAQCDYYTKFIKARDDWEFAGIYSDEGQHQALRGLLADGRRRPGRKNRPGFDQVGEPLRKEHGGQPHNHPDAEGA